MQDVIKLVGLFFDGLGIFAFIGGIIGIVCLIIYFIREGIKKLDGRPGAIASYTLLFFLFLFVTTCVGGMAQA